MATVGQLIVEVGANVAGLQRDLGKMNHMVGKATRQIEGAFKAVGIAVAGYLSVAGLVNFGRHSLDTADRLNKMSQSVGVAVEELSGFAYAARLADVDMESVASNLAKFSKNAVEAAKEGSDAATAFSVMGVNVRDATGGLKSADRLLAEVADRFASYRDGAAKTALAMEIFGKSGASMIPLLNSGSASLQAMREEGERLGLVFSGETARAAEEVNDNITRLKAVFEGASNRIMAGLLPALKEITETFIRVMGPTTDWNNVVAVLTVALQSLAGLLLLVKLGIDGIASAIDWVVKKYDDWTDAIARNTAAYRDANINVDLLTGEQIKTTVESGEKIRKALNTAEGYVAQGKTKIRGTTKDYVAVWSGASASLAEAVDQWRDTSKRLEDAPIIPKALSGAKGGGKAVRDMVAEVVDALKFEEEQLGRTATMQRVYNELKRAGITDTHAMSGAIRELVTRIEERKAAEERLNTLMAEGKRVTEEVQTPLEEYAARVARLNELLAAGAISQKTWDRAVKAASDAYDTAAKKLDEVTEFAKEAARNIQDALGDTLASVLDGKWGEIGDSFRKMLNRMVSELLASQLLKLLLGNFGTTGTMGGLLGGLFGGMFGGGGVPSPAAIGGEGGSLIGAIRMAEGGTINEPIMGLGRSGRRYLMGEAGPERVTPVGKGSNTFIIQTRDPDTRVFTPSRAQSGYEATRLIRRGARLS